MEAPSEMTEDEATRKIVEDSKEFFSVRNLDEAEVYFTKLPPVHHFRLVDKLANSAVESKESDAQLVSEFFSRAATKKLCTPAALEDGLSPISEAIDDIAIDAPKAFILFAIMVKGAGFDEERQTRLASKSAALLALLS
jgi:translation initiation factor 4G